MKGGYGMLNKIRVRHGMKKTQDLKKKKKMKLTLYVLFKEDGGRQVYRF